MGRINVLDKFTAEKIAAGEVVERPASVIKELVENAVDAGATSVTVEIRRGGTEYMRVADNGCGMDSDDAKTAFLRHATSKIKTDADLFSISTLGFRGEALCSIAAVSRTELFTKQRQDGEGTHIVMEGGEMLCAESAGCPDGTTIVVKNLFYNTPARMKFMKKDATEAAAVLDVCNKQALSHPNVSVRFIRDGKEILLTPGDSNLRNAFHAVYGREIADSMVAADYTKGNIRVFGITGKNNLSRPNRLMQICFVNGRYVISKTIHNAISEAYKNELMVGRFPVSVLNVELDASRVDVNVHPGKTEVKFDDDAAVYDAVYWAVKNAVADAAEPRAVFVNPDLSKQAYKIPVRDETAVQMRIEQSEKKASAKASRFTPYVPKQETAHTVRIPTVNQVREAVMPFDGKLPVREIEGAADLSEKKTDVNTPINKKPEEIEPEIKQEKKGLLPPLEEVRIIGQLFETYILAEYENEFILIDQHAAHERIRYEEIKNNENKADSQMLLMPISVSLTPQEKEIISANEQFLLNLGFEAEDFGENSVILRSLPADCPYEEGGDLLIEVARVLGGDIGGEASYARDKAVYTVACRSAIKANSVLKKEETEEIYRRISEFDGISTCPHGRPISVKMTKYQIEKMFKRV